MSDDVTLRDVAREAGVGLATASRALRTSTRVADATRERVRRVAERLGYRRDPGLSRLIERRWHGRRRAPGLNVAFLYNGASSLGDISRQQYPQFRACARQLGYQLIAEDISHADMPMQLQRRLEAQGVAGLVVGGLPSVPFNIDAIFDEFPAVSVNVSVVRPRCPIVMHDEFESVQVAWRHVRAHGYERIGVVMPNHPESLSIDLALGSVLACRARSERVEASVPLLYVPFLSGDPVHDYLAWYEQHRPDAVLAWNANLFNLLTQRGIPLPPCAGISVWGQDQKGAIAGMVRDNVQLLRHGFRLLEVMIQGNTPGVRFDELIQLIECPWADGASLPAKRRTSSA